MTGPDDRVRVAAFDVDGTITRRDCVVPFLRRVAGTATLGRRLVALAIAIVLAGCEAGGSQSPAPARPTYAPSPTRTGARTATGVTAPVRPTWTPMSRTSVATSSAGNLCATAQRGSRVTKPSASCRPSALTL